MISTLTTKGQATIPLVVRRHLGIGPGDKLDFAIEEDGSVRLRRARYPTLASIQGAAGSLKRPRSKAAMLQIAHEDAVAEKYGRQR